MRGIKSKVVYLAVRGKTLLIEDTAEALAYKMGDCDNTDLDRIKKGKSTKLYTVIKRRKSSKKGAQIDTLRNISSKDKRALAFSIITADKQVNDL